MGPLHTDGRQRRWEIKYLPYPYTHWTVENHEQEIDAVEAFMQLWTGAPPALNLSMRSHLVDTE